MDPLLILVIGIASILTLIIVFRVHAFFALLLSALIISLLSGTDIASKLKVIEAALGTSVGKIGLVIAFASVIGACMMESGAADRIVRAFLSLLGEKRASVALMGSGYVLAMPVFFDTVFYLLVPLARSLYRTTKKNYLLYILAIAAGGCITHTLVPPTPGPLAVAAELGVDLGTAIFVGLIVAFPAALAGLAFAAYANQVMPLEMRETTDDQPTPASTTEPRLPSLGLALLPVLLPVILITLSTFYNALIADQAADSFWKQDLKPWIDFIGWPAFALLLSTMISIGLYIQQCSPTRVQLTNLIEKSLMSGGVIILITAAGGAFGAMLQQAQVGERIKSLFENQQADGLMFLFLGFGVASILKLAQGSSTVAMITTAGIINAMLVPLNASGAGLPYNAVYLALAIGSGSLVGSWMNDSGFWIVAKMGGLTETEALKTWTPLLAVLGITSMAATTVLAVLVPQW